MLERRTALGALRIVARTPEAAVAAAELASGSAQTRSHGCDVIQFLGARAYFKRSALSGKSSVRHALRRRLLARPPPRVAEYENLEWLRARRFQSPEPIAAGFLERAGLPRFQFLITREVPEVVTLERFLERASAPRAAVLEALAREIARLHALRFVHHDLYPRNILVAGSGSPPRPWFLDCWAGGPGRQMRGPAYDLACLMLRAPGSLAPEEQRAFFETYAAESEAQGRPVDPVALVDATRRERTRLVRRLALRPTELRGLPPPLLEWVDF